MRIIGDFGWDTDYNDKFTWVRDSGHFVYELMASGDNCPESLAVFYVGVTNNPTARLIEHMFTPHSGAMLAMMTTARISGWAIEMRIADIYCSREAAEEKERDMIAFYTRPNSGFQLMNMEGMLNPVSEWLKTAMVHTEFDEKKCDAHVVEFRKQG